MHSECRGLSLLDPYILYALTGEIVSMIEYRKSKESDLKHIENLIEICFGDRTVYLAENIAEGVKGRDDKTYDL